MGEGEGEGEGEDDSGVVVVRVVAVSSYRRIVVSSSRRPEVGGDEEEERGRGRGRGRGRQRRHRRRVVARAGHWRRHDVPALACKGERDDRVQTKSRTQKMRSRWCLHTNARVGQG